MSKSFFEDMAKAKELAGNPEATRLIKELMKLGYIVVMSVEFPGVDFTQEEFQKNVPQELLGTCRSYGTSKWLAKNIMDLYEAKPHLSALVLAAKFHDQGMHEEAKKLEAVAMIQEIRESISSVVKADQSMTFPDPDPNLKPC